MDLCLSQVGLCVDANTSTKGSNFPWSELHNDSYPTSILMARRNGRMKNNRRNLGIVGLRGRLVKQRTVGWMGSHLDL